MSDQAYANSQDPYWLSSRGVVAVNLINNESPPLAYQNRSILYADDNFDLYFNGNKVAMGEGVGDVTGPNVSLDHHLVRWDGTDGKVIQDSTATLTDTGLLTGITGTTYSSTGANPGGSTTVWVRNSDSHLMRGSVDIEAGVPGGGDVTGPASSIADGICVFDLTTGKIIKCSDWTIDDAGVIRYDGVPFIVQDDNLTSLAIGSDAGATIFAPGNFYNTFLGWRAGYIVNTGLLNTIVGGQAGADITAADNLAIFGANAGRFAGDNCTILGKSAGENCTGTDNIFVGYGSGITLASNESGNLFVGNYGGTASDNNLIVIGGSGYTQCRISGVNGVTTSGGTAVLVNSSGKLGTIVSSERYKKDIEPVVNPLETVVALKPVTFRYKEDDKEKCWGLIAEEVDKVDPDLVLREGDQIETVKYHFLLPLVLGAVKELKLQADEAKSKTTLLEAKLTVAEAELAKLKLDMMSINMKLSSLNV